jgi:hypothetical protein
MIKALSKLTTMPNAEGIREPLIIIKTYDQSTQPYSCVQAVGSTYLAVSSLSPCCTIRGGCGQLRRLHGFIGQACIPCEHKQGILRGKQTESLSETACRLMSSWINRYSGITVPQGQQHSSLYYTYNIALRSK